MTNDSSIIQGKALERHFGLLEAQREFHDLFNGERNDTASERAAVIVGHAFLDHLLQQVLIEFLIDDEEAVKDLLRPDGSLGSYGNRVSVTYCLGFINKVVRNDLKLIGKIRNKFAHDMRSSFDDDQIKTWTLSLKLHIITMMMNPPEGASAKDIYEVEVNQLVSYLSGVVGQARFDRRSVWNDFS